MSGSFTQLVRDMKVGEAKTFTFPTPQKVESAAQLAYRFGQMEGIRIRCKRDFRARKLTVIKEEEDERD